MEINFYGILGKYFPHFPFVFSLAILFFLEKIQVPKKA